MTKLSVADNRSLDLRKLQDADKQLLASYAGQKINKLKQNNPNLFYFPYDFLKTEDRIQTSEIYSLNGFNDNCKLVTGNIVGFLGFNKTLELEITSRFSKNNMFFYYMLQKVFSLNLIGLMSSSKIGQVDLLPYLFPHFLRKALSNGLYRAYKSFDRNDSKVSGNINIARHIKENIPFRGTIAYTCHERVADNDYNQLIRQTIEYIKDSEFKAVLYSQNSVKSLVEKVVQATPAYDEKQRARVLKQCEKEFTSDYFSGYRPLIRLCKAILSQQAIEFSGDNNQLTGLLFDISWLWEEYLWILLQNIDSHFLHSKNRIKKGGISVFNDKGSQRYLDYYKGQRLDLSKDEYRNITIKAFDDEIKSNVVLDAKYKDTPNSDDFHQIISYMHSFPAKKSGFIYPYSIDQEETNISSLNIFNKTPKTVKGYGGEIFCLPMPIISYEVSDFNEYCNKMKECEESFCKYDFFNLACQDEISKESNLK